MGNVIGARVAALARLGSSWRASTQLRSFVLATMIACVPALAAMVTVPWLRPGIIASSTRTAVGERAPAAGARKPIFSASPSSSARAFWPRHSGVALLTHGGGIRGAFTLGGASLRVPSGDLELSLESVGRPGEMQRVAPSRPRSAANTVLYRHGPISERLSNGPNGIEQSFVVAHRPVGSSGLLQLQLRVGGSLHARQQGAQVLFRTADGREALRYGELKASDAAGRPLAARLQLRGRTLTLAIGDRGARYPLRVDPFVQQGPALTTTALRETGVEYFGGDVAISADGSTALVSGLDGSGDSVVWCFARNGSAWSQEGPPLVGSEQVGSAAFGSSLALSAHGDTALVGGMEDNHERGAVWVFTRSGSTWTQQGAKLTGPGEGMRKEAGRFGTSAALSADGNTAIVGAAAAGGGEGAWIFTRAGETWTQQGEKLKPSSGSSESQFGSGVALSADGNTALIGAQYANKGVGGAWVFMRSGATWKQQGGELTGSEELGEGSWLGRSVALSADGNTALVGGPFDGNGAGAFDNPIGAAWVFTRSGEVWTQQGSKLTGAEEWGDGEFGSSVALSGDGGTALIGGWADHSYLGAVWEFKRLGSRWAQIGTKLTSDASLGNPYFGEDLSIAGEAGDALIGASGEGAVWTFAPGVEQPDGDTGAASVVTDVSARLNANVIPDGANVERCEFEYGLSTAYGSSAPCEVPPGAGETPVAVAAPVGGLEPGVTYHFRIVATNVAGTGYGEDGTFRAIPTSLATAKFDESFKVAEYEVPLGVTRVRALAIGAPGATAYGTNGGAGADGAQAVGDLSVTPGETLYVVVGSPGTSGSCGSGGGWGEGGGGESHCGGSSSGGGGGASSVRTCPNSFTAACPSSEAIERSRVLVAGGGGGAGSGAASSRGGSGGGALTDGKGAPGMPGEPLEGAEPGGGGGGATLSSGGEAGAMPGSCSGGNLAGAGGFDRGGGGGLFDTAGGGGGGGWYGGGGGGGGGKTSCGSPEGGGGGGGGGSSHGPAGATFSEDTTGEAVVTLTPVQPLPPIVATAGTASQSGSVELEAEVTPEGSRISECFFEYGISPSAQTRVSCESLPGESEALVRVSALLTGLREGMTYYFRIAATNAVATTHSAFAQFTTGAVAPAPPPLPPPPLPAPSPPASTQPAAPTQAQTTPLTSAIAGSAVLLEPITQPPAAFGPVEVAGTVLRTSRMGTVSIGLTCPSADLRCRGTVVLTGPISTQANRARGRPRNLPLTLASASFALPGGRTEPVVLRLTSTARALLVRVGRIRARATITVRDTAGARHVTSELLSVAAAPRRRHR